MQPATTPRRAAAISMAATTSRGLSGSRSTSPRSCPRQRPAEPVSRVGIMP